MHKLRLGMFHAVGRRREGMGETIGSSTRSCDLAFMTLIECTYYLKAALARQGGLDPNCLNLVTTTLSAATGLLELASLGANIGFGVRMGHSWRQSEVLHGFTSILWSPQQHSVGSFGFHQRKLIKSQALTSGLDNARTGSFRKPECANFQLRHFVEADVVRHSTHDDSNLVLLALHVFGQSGQRERCPVGLALKEPLEHDLVESGIGTTCQEAIKLLSVEVDRP